VIHGVLRATDLNRHRLESVLSYPEDTAGMMNVDAITVRADVSLTWCTLPAPARKSGSYRRLVVNRYDKYLGMLPLTTLLTQRRTSL
jgi:magnesium transporter